MNKVILGTFSSPTDHTESLVGSLFWFLNRHEAKARGMFRLMKRLLLQHACDEERSVSDSLVMDYEEILSEMEDLFTDFREERVYNVVQGLA
jgi:hypothetical protein